MLIKDLEALVAVVEADSLTRAADRLCLTQSAVSRRLQSLESSMGVALFDRTLRPPKPNAMGLRVYQQALRLVRDARQLMSLPQEDLPPSGLLRIGFTQTVPQATVVNVLSQLRAAYPALSLQMVTHWSRALEEQLLQGNLDAATLLVPAPGNLPEGLQGSRIATLEVVVVQSADMPSVTSPASLHSLAQHPWVLNPEGCGYRAALEAALHGRGQALKLGVDAYASGIQARLVAGGFGLGLLPAMALEDPVLAEGLQVVQVRDFSLAIEVWLAHAPQPGNLRQAIDSIEAVVTQGFLTPETIPATSVK